MISRWLRPFTSSTANDSVFAPAQMILNQDNDGLVYVSARSLIGLRHAAESLSLKSAKIRALQTGEYYSPFKGRGMEFDEVRTYQPGDDIKTIDWRVTARSGTPHTKLFREERERSVLLFVDFRQSMFFATRGAFKSVIAAKAAALMAWSAAHQRDRLGGLLFSEKQHQELRPQRSKIAVTHILQTLSQQTKLAKHAHENDVSVHAQEQALHDALARLRRVSKPGSLLLLFSDFRGLSERAESHLYQLARHNDVVLIYVYDPLEAELPPSGYYQISDRNKTIAIDTSDKTLRAEYSFRHEQHQQRLVRIAHRHHMHLMLLPTNADLVTTLQQGLGIRSHAPGLQ